MGCCGKKKDGPKKPSDRSCTDVLCLLIFLIFLAVLGGIFGLAVIAGDFHSLRYDQDYLGNRCGVGSYTTASGTTIDLTTRTKAFYPRIPLDMMEQQAVVESGNFMDLKLYAVCVEECPTDFNIVDPESSMITDYGYDPTSAVTQAFGSGTRELWLSATPTVDIMNRCVPRTESNQGEASMCAYPKCTSAAAVAAGAICSTHESFQNGEWEVCPESGSGEVTDAKCAEQQDVCKIRATETVVMTYEMYTTDDASKAMLAQIAGLVGGLFEIMSSIAAAWLYIILGGVVLPVLFAFAYMLLLFLFAKIIIYSLLIVLILAELLATFVCFSRSGISFQGTSGADLLATASAYANVSIPSEASAALETVNEDSTWLYSIGFLILGIISVITIITVIVSRRKIAICAAIVTEATTVFSSMPLLMFFPSLSTIVQLVVCAWFVGTMVLLQTQKAESLDVALNKVVNTSAAEFIQLNVQEAAPSVDPIASLRGIISNTWYPTGSTVVVLYGFLTLVQWVQGIAWCSMAGAVYYWYFFRPRKELTLSDDAKAEETKIPITKSFGRTLFYHSGSVAFAAFVIAACDMLRIAAQYIEAQMGPTKNFLVKLAFKVLHCCLYCLKKTVKFVSYYGLVFVSCQGLSFCMGCYRTFFFFLQNPGQVAINATVTFLLRLMAMLSIPLGCAVVLFYLMDSVLLSSDYNAMYPAAIIFVLAAVMTVSCMTVFECTITTIFVCCFQDKAQFGAKHMSNQLAKAFHIKKKDNKEAVVEVAPPEGEKK